MAPAALRARDGEYLLERGPEAERPVAHGQAGSDQTAVLQPDQHLAPAPLGLVHAVGDRQKALLAAFVHPPRRARQPVILGCRNC